MSPVFSTQDNTISPTGTGSWGSNGAVDASGATLVTANNDYFEFALDTTGQTAVYLSFDALFKTPNGPRGLAVYYGTSNARPESGTQVFNNATAMATANVWNSFGAGNSIAFTTGLNPSGLTYFRIYAFNAGNTNSGSDINIDNVLFTGCGIPSQPTITKTFAPNPVAVNSSSTLTFTLTNPNTVQLTGAQFTDNLPAGLEVAPTPAASTTCTGSPSWAPTPGATVLAFGQTTGANIPASGSCTASVSVRATTAGPHTNVSGFISTTESGTNSGAGGSATASLTAVLPPSIAKSFGTNPILSAGNSLLTFTLSNPNPNDTLSGVSFSDTYPSGLTNINPLTPAVVNTCGGAVTAAAGGPGISLSGGTIAGGASCTVAVRVTAASPGSYVNTTGAVSATTAGTGNTATDTLVVNAPNPSIALLKQISTSPSGPWSRFISVTPSTLVYYQFTMENTGDVALSPVSVNDPTVSTASCTWPASLPVASATQDPTAACVVGPITAIAGSNVNTATARGTFSGVEYSSAPASSEYIGATPGFSLLKQIGTSATGPWSSSISVALGSNVYYRFTLVNTGGVALSPVSVTDVQVSTGSCAFSDPLAVGSATTCVVGPIGASATPGTFTNTATGHGTNGGTTIDTESSSASYTAGSNADLAVTKTNGASSVIAGSTTTYIITVSNNGPASVTAATLSDPAVSGLSKTAVACSSTPGQCATAPTMAQLESGAFTLPTLASGQTYQITVTANVIATSGNVSNVAAVSVPAGMTDPNGANNSATDTDTVSGVPSLIITKSNGVSTVNAAGSTSYTVTITNNGTATATGISWTDVVGSGLTITGIAPGTASAGSVLGTCSLITLSCTGITVAASGGSVTYTVTATVTGIAGNNAVNTANVGGGGCTAGSPSSPANCTSTDTDLITTIIPLPVPILTVSNIASVATIAQNGTYIYTVAVSNTGFGLSVNPVISYSVPAGVTITGLTNGAGWVCTPTTLTGAGTITCTKATGVISGVTNETVMILNATKTSVSSVTTTATITSGDPACPAAARCISAAVVNDSSTFGASPPQGIPTLSEWGSIILSGIVALVAFFSLRRLGNKQVG